jgi:hypothetical protein
MEFQKFNSVLDPSLIAVAVAVITAVYENINT